MKHYLTQLQAMNPKTGELQRWAGPRILANDRKEAERILNSTGMGYCQIVGFLEDVISMEEFEERGNHFSIELNFEFNLN